jgi:hypothetical protein
MEGLPNPATISAALSRDGYTVSATAVASAIKVAERAGAVDAESLATALWTQGQCAPAWAITKALV